MKLTTVTALCVAALLGALVVMPGGAEASARDEVEALVREHPVLLFTKSYCGFCKRSLLLLDKMGVLSHNVVLNEMGAKGGEYQAALKEITGQRTVPNIFVGGAHVGGNSDLQAAHSSGKLAEMLAALDKQQ